jgi:hypothetical protein
MINFDPSIIAPDFTIRDGSLNSGVSVSKTLLLPNPSRVFLQFGIITAAAAVLVRPVLPADAFNGFPGSNTSQIPPFIFQNCGPLVCQQWSLFAAGAVQIYWTEVIFTPDRGGA